MAEQTRNFHGDRISVTGIIQSIAHSQASHKGRLQDFLDDGVFFIIIIDGVKNKCQQQILQHEARQLHTLFVHYFVLVFSQR